MEFLVGKQELVMWNVREVKECGRDLAGRDLLGRCWCGSELGRLGC